MQLVIIRNMLSILCGPIEIAAIVCHVYCRPQNHWDVVMVICAAQFLQGAPRKLCHLQLFAIGHFIYCSHNNRRVAPPAKAFSM